MKATTIALIFTRVAPLKAGDESRDTYSRLVIRQPAPASWVDPKTGKPYPGQLVEIGESEAYRNMGGFTLTDSAPITLESEVAP